MKGDLHTADLMHAVVAPGCGLRTARRISHVYLMDVPDYPRPLLLTDAAINITPDLMDKAAIVQNAIELAHVIGIDATARGDPGRRRNDQRPDAVHARCGGAVQDGRSRTDHRRIAGRPAGVRQRDQ